MQTGSIYFMFRDKKTKVWQKKEKKRKREIIPYINIKGIYIIPYINIYVMCSCRYLIIENFIPPEEKNKIMNRLTFDPEEDQWKFQPLVPAERSVCVSHGGMLFPFGPSGGNNGLKKCV